MSTDSNAITIHELLHERCVYQMPLFQREYQWREHSELSHFWDDLVSVVDDEIDVSFLGAVVLQIEKTGTSKSSQIYTVIDGQQRITTFFLMMCAIVATARVHGWTETAADLETQYLVSALSAEKGRAKLVPTFRDNANFNEVIKNIPNSPVKLLPDTGMPDGPMVLAYQYLTRRVGEFLEGEKSGTTAKTEDRLSKLYNALLEKMEVVQIILDKAHNANEVFDRLNTAGRPLSTMDLVRNELFQTVSEDYDKAEKLYSSLWAPFEKNFDEALEDHDSETRSSIVDDFFFPYALTYLPSAKKNKLLPDLRRIWAKLSLNPIMESAQAHDLGALSIDPTLVITSLESMRSPYLAMDQGIRLDKVSDALWEAILNLRGVPVPGVTHPYFMKLLSEVMAGSVGDADALAVCAVLESFFVRRGLVGLEPTGLHSIFKKLWDDAKADPSLVKKSIQTGTISFPPDEEVLRAIEDKGLYKKRVEKYVLRSYEAHLQQTSLAKLSYLPKITADHVMPQDWQGEWKKVISKEDHERVVDLWGNLVPLSSPENSAKGAKSFGEAKALLSQETAFLTTKRLMAKTDTWDKETILARCIELADWAITRWPK
ncbi:MAG TPA: DUF262 domain-containing protein [Terriglobales bacterium]|nr:DUF262 domain-containing protein [Terriglobales bacterium]